MTREMEIALAQREACAKFIEEASLREGRPVHAERCRAAPLVVREESHTEQDATRDAALRRVYG